MCKASSFGGGKVEKDHVGPLARPNRRVMEQNLVVLEQGLTICSRALTHHSKIAPDMLLGSN